MTNAEVVGVEIGSTEVKFSLGAIKSGSYAIDGGTVGSISLVLQTLLLLCAFTNG